VIRLAPAPLYTTYHELWQTVEALREIVERGEHFVVDSGRELVA
jgi:kynureninase